MDEAQTQALTEKLTTLGCPEFEVLPGQEDVLMLHVRGCFIGGALYALSLPDEQLRALIEETLAYGH